MKKSFVIFLTLIASLLLLGTAQAQSVRFPVSSNFQIVGPLQPFVYNYSTVPLPPTQIQLTFTDATAGSRDVYLEFSLESNEVKMSTPPGYRPDPINLNVNTPYLLTASDLAPYFDQTRLLFEGNFASVTRETGRLPEGLYKFNIKVRDYQSGAILSNPTPTPSVNFAQANLKYNDPPRIITPRCEDVSPPMDPQRILFTWQSMGGVQAASQTEYRLLIYELTDPTADPQYAIYNNKIQTVYESDYNPGTTFLYDIQYPQLETGKVYIYQVQAIDRADAVVYKNDGRSEVCWFRYGYPTGGVIPLKSPENESGFERKVLKEFVWEAPDNRIENQPFSYELRIVEMQPDQEPEEAIEINPTWTRKLLTETRFTGDNKHVQRSPRIEDAQHYAWQVRCNSGQQEVAKSKVQTFFGPQTLKYFMAGTEKVEVLSTKNKDVKDLSGKAKISLGPYGKIKGNFNHIHVEDTYGTDNWVLIDGAVILPLDGKIDDIELKPMNPRNGAAWFRPDSIKVDKDGIWLGGFFDWAFPHPVDGGGQPKIKSKYEYVPFNQFRLNGAIHLPEGGYKFGLAEPLDYEMRLDEKSHIYFTDNYYTLKMFGDVKLPKRMTENFAKEEVIVPFQGIEQLFYLRLENNRMPYNFQLASNGNIFLKPTHLELDLDATQSPQAFTDRSWKGAYFRGFELEFQPTIDKNRQLTFEETVIKKINRETDPDYQNVKSWFDSKGLQFEIDGVFNEQDSGFVNSFPSQMTQFALKIEDSKYYDGKIRGKFKIPVISASQDFNYTIPINNGEITDVFMEADLVGQTFKYNTRSKEQEVHLTINRVVFKDYNHLDFNVDMDWPDMQCHLRALRNFKAWGNHSCGFNVPNGTFAADEHARAYVGENKYPVVLDAVGIGSDYKVYSFATTGKIQLGLDVVGEKGPPVVNLYSVIPNPYGIRIYGKANDEDDPAAAYDQKIAEYKQGKEELKEGLETSLSKTLAELEAYQEQSKVEPVAFNDIITEKETTEAKSTAPSSANNQISLEELFDGTLTDVSESLLRNLTNKIAGVGTNVTTKLNEAVDAPTTEAESYLSDQINYIFDGIEKSLTPKAKVKGIDLTDFMQSLVNTTRASTLNEGRSSLRSSVNAQVVEPLVTIIEVEVQDAIVVTLAEATKQAALSVLTTQDRKSAIANATQNVVDNMGGMVQNVFNGLVSQDKLKGMTLGLASTFVGSISVQRIMNDVLNQVLREATKLAGALALDKAKEELQKALNEKLKGVPINFAGAADALQNGNPKALFKVDRIPIKVPDNPIINVTGMLIRSPNDPVYGDVWTTSNLEIEIKVPKRFYTKARVIQGRKEGKAYWLMEAGNVSNDRDSPFGNTAVCVPTELNTPLNLGLFKVTHMAGRISNHMSDGGNGQMIPDPNNNSNAMFNFIIEDTKNGDVFNANVFGEVNSNKNGSTITLKGDISVKQDMLQAKVLIYHNTAEDHFLCQADIKVQKDGAFCAEGRFLLDVKPSKWRIAMGTRDLPIQIVPGCAGWAGVGYVDMNQSSAEIGAGAGMAAIAKSPKFPLLIYMVQVGVDAGFDIMMFTNINYRPIRINEAGLIVRAWVYIWEEHKRFVGCGIKKCRTKRNSIVEITMRGDLLMRFHPKPTNLAGSFKGKVKLLGIGIGFNTKFSKNIG